MKTVSIDELKRNLSSLVDQAAAGARILITKHRRPIATLSAADMEHVHVGPRFGRGTLKPLLRAPTQGKYLEVLEDDRRPAAGRRRPAVPAGRYYVDTSAYLCLLLGEAGWQRLAGELDGGNLERPPRPRSRANSRTPLARGTVDARRSPKRHRSARTRSRPLCSPRPHSRPRPLAGHAHRVNAALA